MIINEISRISRLANEEIVQTYHVTPRKKSYVINDKYNLFHDLDSFELNAPRQQPVTKFPRIKKLCCCCSDKFLDLSYLLGSAPEHTQRCTK